MLVSLKWRSSTGNESDIPSFIGDVLASTYAWGYGDIRDIAFQIVNLAIPGQQTNEQFDKLVLFLLVLGSLLNGPLYLMKYLHY